MLSEEQIKEIFEEKFEGVNVITPLAIAFGERGDYIFEVTTGELEGNTVYGFSVLKAIGNNNYAYDLNKSTLCLSANDLINNLNNII